ncbi:MAG: hypothetical protein RLO50_12225 [Azospirillaceae bacterium]
MRDIIVFAVFVIAALLGLFAGASAQTVTGQTAGVLMAAAAVLVLFRLVGRYMDGRHGWQLVDVRPVEPASNAVLAVIAGIAALGGLFLATLHDPLLYWAGLGLAAAFALTAIAAAGRAIDGGR